MSDKYIVKCTLSANGTEITDFKGFAENEIVYRKQINLMNKTGHSVMTPRYGVSLDYVVPSAGDEYDWKAVENGTLVVEYDGGRRVLYSGASTLTVGEAALDMDNELVKKISLGASDRREE